MVDIVRKPVFFGGAWIEVGTEVPDAKSWSNYGQMVEEGYVSEQSTEEAEIAEPRAEIQAAIQPEIQPEPTPEPPLTRTTSRSRARE